MTVENLYRAIGDVDEKHLKRLIDSEKSIINASNSRRSSLSERTIVMDVVKQKKIRLRIFAVAAAVLVAAGVVAAALLGPKKDKKEYKEKKIENYFTEDENFEFSGVNIASPELVYSDNDGIYVSGLMYFGSDIVHPNVTVYNISDKQMKIIELEDFNTEYFEAMSVSEKNIWLKYYNDSNSEEELIRIDTDTQKVSGKLHYGKDSVIIDVTENDDGTYLIRRSIYSDDKISDLLYSVYDSDLNIVSEKSIIDQEIMNIPDTVLVSNVRFDDESYYTVYTDGDEKIYNLYKYSSEDEVMYSVENITADLEGIYTGLFITVNGNPAVYSYDSKTDLYYFDEYDAEDGYIINRYEINMEDTASMEYGWSSPSAVLAKGASGEYDFAYINDKKVYGCKSADDGKELIADLSMMFMDSVNLSSLAVSDNLILLSGEYVEISESGSYICKSDHSGNILAKTKISNITGKDNVSLRKIFSDKNGEIWVLMNDGYSNKSIVVNLDQNMNSKKIIDFDIGAEDFIVDSYGRIALSDYVNEEIILYDSEGNHLYSEKITKESHCFEADGKYYTAVPNIQKSGTVIYLLDFDKKNISEITVLDFEIKDTMNGFGKYDVCFAFNDGIYGYNLDKNTLEEVINWIDSDLDFDPDIFSIIDENKIICRYWGNGEVYKPFFTLLKRVDDETLKTIQERKVLNVAAGFMTENMRNQIKEFNKINNNYRVHIDDFSKYSNNITSYFNSSGLSALESEFINGYVPDVIIFGDDFDILKYKGFNAFAGIDELMPDIVSGQNEYFDNIIDAYKFGDGNNLLPLTYTLHCMTGKSKSVNGKTAFTVSELFEMNEDIPVFYGESYEDLTNVLINANINEFIDMNEFTCDFENERFRKILELIKDNGVTTDEHIKILSSDINTYNTRISDELCKLMPYSISSFSSITRNDLYHRMDESTIYTGLPSEKSNGIILDPITTAAVFASSENKDGAAEFLKYMISEDVQYQSCLLYDYPYCFPVNKSAYQRIYEKQKNTESSMFQDCHGENILEDRPDLKTLRTVNNMIESITVTSLSDSTIRKIIDEQASLYYSDGQSVEETAKKIQQKVSLYLKEIK